MNHRLRSDVWPASGGISDELHLRTTCKRVIEAAGAQATLGLAPALTGTYGRLIIAGYHQDGPRQVNVQLWNWRAIDVINAHERIEQSQPRVCVKQPR